MSRPPDLTPAEFNVMKALWQLGRATVAETRAALTKRDGAELAYTTVMTLLGRLAAKGAVGVDKDREPYIYAPAYRRESILRDRLRSFLSDVFDGDSHAMVLGLVADESLSLDELRAIEKDLGSDAEPAAPIAGIAPPFAVAAPSSPAPRGRHAPSSAASSSAASSSPASSSAASSSAASSSAASSSPASSSPASSSPASSSPAPAAPATSPAAGRRDRKERRS